MGHDETEFSYPRSNLIESRNGFTVEVRSRNSITYTAGQQIFTVFAEPLVGEAPRMIIRRAELERLQAAAGTPPITEPERDEIVENIRRAFAFKGWILIVE
jgi:hypothetical protein